MNLTLSWSWLPPGSKKNIAISEKWFQKIWRKKLFSSEPNLMIPLPMIGTVSKLTILIKNGRFLDEKLIFSIFYFRIGHLWIEFGYFWFFESKLAIFNGIWPFMNENCSKLEYKFEVFMTKMSIFIRIISFFRQKCHSLAIFRFK